MGSIDVNDRNELIKILQKKDFARHEKEWQAILKSADLQKSLNYIDLEGSPFLKTSSVVDYLNEQGRVSYNHHAIGRFLNIINDLGFLDEAYEKPFVDGLLTKYQLMTPSIPLPSTGTTTITDITAKYFNEAVIGEDTLRPIGFMLQAIKASSSICYVGISGGGSGTGFLVGEDLAITNNHVIKDRTELAQSIFRFNYQIGIDGRPETEEEFKPNVDGLFDSSPPEDLDYTVFQLEGNPGSKWGWLKLDGGNIKKGDRVNIIQHPGGMPKQISIQNNFVEYVDDKIVQYLATTLRGSSGSPVLNNSWGVAALHHRGGNLIEPKTNSKFLRNEGIRISAVLKNLPNDISQLIRSRQ